MSSSHEQPVQASTTNARSSQGLRPANVTWPWAISPGTGSRNHHVTLPGCKCQLVHPHIGAACCRMWSFETDNAGMLATQADLHCPGRKGHAEAGEEVALIRGQYAGAVTMGTKDTEE